LRLHVLLAGDHDYAIAQPIAELVLAEDDAQQHFERHVLEINVNRCIGADAGVAQRPLVDIVLDSVPIREICQYLP
jgi:hypothetical protein